MCSYFRGEILGKRALLLYTIRCMWILGRICVVLQEVPQLQKVLLKRIFIELVQVVIEEFLK
jgi:hypothetical protein